MVPIERLGATPVAMTLGDVVPAMQQGAVDGAVGGIVVWTPMHFQRRGKIRHRDRPAGGLRHRRDQQVAGTTRCLPDLQKLVDSDAAAGQAAIGPTANDIVAKSRKGWTDAGGELISLPADEQAELMKTFAAGAARRSPKQSRRSKRPTRS